MSNKKSKKITKLNKRGPGRPRKSCRNTRLKKSCARHSRCSWRKGTGCVRKPSKRKSTKKSKKSKRSYKWWWSKFAPKNRTELKKAVDDYIENIRYGRKKYGTIGNWDVSNVTDMSNMFWGAERFNQPLDSWNVSNVTNMSNMFEGAERFNQPLNNWNVSNVTNMSNMFWGAKKFNQPLDSWNVSNVTNMSNMFRGAEGFNEDISSWNVSNVTNMNFMFEGAQAMIDTYPQLSQYYRYPDKTSWKSYFEINQQNPAKLTK